jgi:hypothetical protein
MLPCQPIRLPVGERKPIRRRFAKFDRSSGKLTYFVNRMIPSKGSPFALNAS